jgi:hypothetical protein
MLFIAERKRGWKFILAAHGTTEEVARARSILQTTRTCSIDTHVTVDKEASAVA